MKAVSINGNIGYSWWDGSGVTLKGLQKQLEGLEPGEEIRISINSAGGSASEGFVIFNLIRDYAKTHPVSVVIDCMAMSIASYIALAARTVDAKAKITARENSIFAIHNPYMYTHGDYRELKKMSDYLEKITAVYASAHITVSGKTEKEIRAAMDNETFYIGQEIEAAGFANDYEAASSSPESESSESPAAHRDNIIITAKFALDGAIEKTKKAEAKNPAAYNSDLEKVVALITPNTPAASSAKPGDEINIKLDTLLTKVNINALLVLWKNIR
jgi:ATP-dependent protease ClpP protease subunit